MVYVFRSTPSVKQVLPSEVLDTPLAAGVTYDGPDESVTFTLDPVTASIVMQAIRDHAVEQEREARRAVALGDYAGHYASASHRLRAVEEAYSEAQFQVHGPMPTYDND